MTEPRTEAGNADRPVERPVLADRCVCAHLWTDHTTWCDSSGCPCRFTTTAPLDVERLAKALHKVLPRRGDLVSSTDWANAAHGILATLRAEGETP